MWRRDSSGREWRVTSAQLLVGCLLALICALTCLVPNAGATAASRTDVMFVFDTSGSMNAVLDEAKAEIQEVMTHLGTTLPNAEFGVAESRDYAPSPYDEESDDRPWTLDTPVTSDLSSVNEAISRLAASGGGDGPEAYGRALWETDTNPNVGWRPGARHLIVLIADQVPHDTNLDEGIPEEDWLSPAPWDTGDELAGSWGIPGTQLAEGTGLAFHDVLRQLAADGKPLEMVDYHDTEGDFIHYWESWAGLAGGEAFEASEEGHELASKLISLIEHAPEDTACATSAVPSEPSPRPPGILPTAATPRFLKPGTSVILTPASGEFCQGQVPQLGGATANPLTTSTTSQLAFQVPPSASSGLALDNLSSVPGPTVRLDVDNFRYPWGFTLLNRPGDGTPPDFDAKLSQASIDTDLEAVFKGLGPRGSFEWPEAEADAREALEGLCYGFALLSWATYADSHGQHIPLGYLSSPGFGVGAGTVPYLLSEASTGNHGLTHALLRAAVSQVSPEEEATWHSVGSSASLASQLNTAFAQGDPAPIMIRWGAVGHEEGHALLAYNYQSPDPTTGQGIAVDVVDPNVPWSASSPPSDYQNLQLHVSANGSWTYAGTFDGVNFATPVSNSSQGLKVITHPLAAGGLQLHTQLSGNPTPIAIAAPRGDEVTAISYSSADGHDIPSDVTGAPTFTDGVDDRLLVPGDHHKLIVSYTAPSGDVEPIRITGAGFLDSGSLGAGHKTLTLNARTGGITLPVADTGTSLSIASLTGGVQRGVTARFSGKLVKPTLSVSSTGAVSLTVAGGDGHVSISLAGYSSVGDARGKAESIAVHGRTSIHRHTPKIKSHKRRKRRLHAKH